MANKPKFEEFEEWAKNNLGFDPTDKAVQNWTELNVGSARGLIQQHGFVTRIQEFVTAHQASPHRANINIVGAEFQLHVKSYQSILSKLFRANILSNRAFPSPPKSGWVDTKNMFGRINDLVRSTIVCRHINDSL